MWFLRMVLVAALACSGALIAPQPARSSADTPSGDPAIVISALHYYGYEGALDEAIQLTNTRGETMTLDANWSLADQADHRLAFPTLVLPPAGRVWIARDRPAFVRQFGFTPTLTYGDMAGAPLVFANNGGSVRLITATQTITVPGTLALVDTANSDTTHWDAGSKTPFRASMERVDAGLPNTPGNWQSALLPAAPAVDAAGRPITGTPRSRNSVAVTPTTPTSLTVVINEVAWSGTPVSPTREWVELYNALTTSVSLAGWKLAISGTTIYTVALSGAIEPGGYYLIQRYADTFGPGVLADLTSSSLQLRDNGAVLSLIESSSGSVTPGVERVVDALVYGDGAPQPGWSGPPLQPYVVTGTITPAGQVLMRALDPAGGLPLTGAGMAQGWVNRRGDPVTSRRPVYPGWDMDRFTAPVVATGAVTLAVTPDGGFAVLSQTLSAATRSIEAEVYVFEHPALAALLRMKSAQGVSVRLLLEGSPAGGLSNQEKWACQQINASGNPYSGCWFMHSDPPSNAYARYPHLHSKFAVVDGRLLVVSSENFGANGFPDDDKTDGTVGQRGVIAVVDSPPLVRRAREIFDADLDTAHQDIARWCGTCSPFGPPSPGFTPVFTTGGISYTVRFPSAIRIAAPVTIEMATSPESHLREGGILAVLNSAGPGDEVLAQQLDEPAYWGPSNSNPDADPNPRLQALLGAAQRGARVRVVLDRYYDSPADARSNQSTVDWLTALAQRQWLGLARRDGRPHFSRYPQQVVPGPRRRARVCADRLVERHRDQRQAQPRADVVARIGRGVPGSAAGCRG